MWNIIISNNLERKRRKGEMNVVFLKKKNYSRRGVRWSKKLGSQKKNIWTLIKHLHIPKYRSNLLNATSLKFSFAPTTCKNSAKVLIEDRVKFVIGWFACWIFFILVQALNKLFRDVSGSNLVFINLQSVRMIFKELLGNCLHNFFFLNFWTKTIVQDKVNTPGKKKKIILTQIKIRI